MDIPRFFQACNPSRALTFQTLEDQQFYIDYSPVRGSNLIRELGRTIALSSSTPNCQLFTGHVGCGKSTELLRLKADLERPDLEGKAFHVVYFESDQDLDVSDVDVSDILLAIARQVSASLEATQIRLKPGYFKRLLTEVGGFLTTPIELDFEAELSVGIGKLTAKTKESPDLRGQLRQYLEPRTGNILESINKELLEPALKLLQAQNKKGLVVIIDNLDRMYNSTKPSGRSQPEYLFVERGDQLRKLRCHLVYTIPIELIFSNSLVPLTNRFGFRPKILPMVPVRRKDNSPHAAGLQLLRQMVLARAFPELTPDQRLQQVGQIFEDLDTLDRLCSVSGGHVRNLLVLMMSCLQKTDPPFSRAILEEVIRGFRDDSVLGVTDQQWDLMRQVHTRKQVEEAAEYQTLLRNLYVFEYCDDTGRWFDVNPALAEATEFQG